MRERGNDVRFVKGLYSRSVLRDPSIFQGSFNLTQDSGPSDCLTRDTLYAPSDG